MKNKKKKPNPYLKTCERCGNDGLTKKIVFRCRFCGYLNGVEEEYMQYGVEVTRGGIDDR